MCQTIERIGGSILRRELEYGETIALPDNTPEKRNKKIAAFYALADKCVIQSGQSVDISMTVKTGNDNVVKSILMGTKELKVKSDNNKVFTTNFIVPEDKKVAFTIVVVKR